MDMTREKNDVWMHEHIYHLCVKHTGCNRSACVVLCCDVIETQRMFVWVCARAFLYVCLRYIQMHLYNGSLVAKMCSVLNFWASTRGRERAREANRQRRSRECEEEKIGVDLLNSLEFLHFDLLFTFVSVVFNSLFFFNFTLTFNLIFILIFPLRCLFKMHCDDTATLCLQLIQNKLFFSFFGKKLSQFKNDTLK